MPKLAALLLASAVRAYAGLVEFAEAATAP